MKTRLIIPIAGALVALGAVSCSSDDTHQGAPDQRAIRFAAQSPSLSRAGVVTTEGLTEFSVFAYTNGKPFMSDVQVTKDASNVWTYSPVAYWPASPVNFYAFSPSTWGDGVTDITAPIDYYAQYGSEDLIYSVAMGQTQSAGPVLLNFRHALSKINININSEKSDQYDIKISNVTILGAATNGTFTFPAETTAAGTGTVGTWTNQTGSSAYIYYMAGTAADALVLSPTPQNVNQVTDGFLVPQQLTAMDQTETGVTGDQISIDVIIYDKTTGEQLWPNSETPKIENISNAAQSTGRLYFPLLTQDVTEWKPGYQYNYNITINQPRGLEPIEFGQPSVDTFVEVDVVPD